MLSMFRREKSTPPARVAAVAPPATHDVPPDSVISPISTAAAMALAAVTNQAPPPVPTENLASILIPASAPTPAASAPLVDSALAAAVDAVPIAASAATLALAVSAPASSAASAPLADAALTEAVDAVSIETSAADLALVAAAEATLPILLHHFVRPPVAGGYFVTAEDVIAAIREGKNDFIMLLTGDDETTVSLEFERLWRRLNGLAFERLSAHLQHTIRERQKTMISDYARDLGEWGIPNIVFLNDMLSTTFADADPVYASLGRKIYEKYVNQFMESLESGGSVRYNGICIRREDVAPRVAADLITFLKLCRKIYTLQYDVSTPVVFRTEIDRFEKALVEAKTAFDRASKRYEHTIAEVESLSRAYKIKRQGVREFAARFADEAPSSFKRALEERGIRPEQDDFQDKLMRIMMRSSLRLLDDYLYEAIVSGSPETVEILLSEFKTTRTHPLEPGEGDAISNRLLCKLAEMAAAADTAVALDGVIRKLSLLLDATENIKYLEARRMGNKERVCYERAREYVLSVFLLKEGEKTVLELFLDANKFMLLLTLRTYITDEAIYTGIRRDSSPFERKIYKSLKAYEMKLRPYEERLDLRSVLRVKTEVFDYRVDLPDEFYNRLIQRRKALEVLMLALWEANTTKTNTLIISQIRYCKEQCARFSEPDAIIFKKDELATPLSLAYDRDYRHLMGNERGPVAGTDLKAGTGLEHVTFEYDRTLVPYDSTYYYQPAIASFPAALKERFSRFERERDLEVSASGGLALHGVFSTPAAQPAAGAGAGAAACAGAGTGIPLSAFSFG